MFVTTNFDQYIENPLNNGQVKIYLEIKRKIEYIKFLFVSLLSLPTSYFIIFETKLFGLMASDNVFGLSIMFVFLSGTLMPLVKLLFNFIEVNLYNEHYILIANDGDFLSGKRADFSFTEFPESIKSEKGLKLKENILNQDRKPFFIEIFILDFYENEFKENLYKNHAHLKDD